MDEEKAQIDKRLSEQRTRMISEAAMNSTSREWRREKKQQSV